MHFTRFRMEAGTCRHQPVEVIGGFRFERSSQSLTSTVDLSK